MYSFVIRRNACAFFSVGVGSTASAGSSLGASPASASAAAFSAFSAFSCAERASLRALADGASSARFSKAATKKPPVSIKCGSRRRQFPRTASQRSAKSPKGGNIDAWIFTLPALASAGTDWKSW